MAPSVMTPDAALDGRLELVTSPKLLAEVADVLGRPRLRRYGRAPLKMRIVSRKGSGTSIVRRI